MRTPDLRIEGPIVIDGLYIVVYGNGMTSWPARLAIATAVCNDYNRRHQKSLAHIRYVEPDANTVIKKAT